MIYEFDKDFSYKNSVEIEDPGNCSIRCTSGEGYDYYLLTKSEDGILYIMEWGPLMADMPTDVLPPPDDRGRPFNLTVKTMKFDSNKLDKEIQYYIDCPAKGVKISAVEDVDQHEALGTIPVFNLAWNSEYEKAYADE